jgi:hypothetical protein
MDEDLKQVLTEYALTIRTCGWEAGEEFIAVYEEEYPDFRRWAYALAIVLRIRELLAQIQGPVV